MSLAREKTSVVIGASPNPRRYSYKAIELLRSAYFDVVALGIRAGDVADISIRLDRPDLADVDTVTLYLNPLRQLSWTDYIFSLKPRRVIFNPGTEHIEFEQALNKKGIIAERACTLVLLRTEQY